jgi:predicted transcriptional regulator
MAKRASSQELVLPARAKSGLSAISTIKASTLKKKVLVTQRENRTQTYNPITESRTLRTDSKPSPWGSGRSQSRHAVL